MVALLKYLLFKQKTIVIHFILLLKVKVEVKCAVIDHLFPLHTQVLRYDCNIEARKVWLIL